MTFISTSRKLPQPERAGVRFFNRSVADALPDIRVAGVGRRHLDRRRRGPRGQFCEAGALDRLDVSTDATQLRLREVSARAQFIVASYTITRPTE